MKRFLLAFCCLSLILAIAGAVCATPITGSITVSLILTDENGNIIDGSGKEGTFSMRLSSLSGSEMFLEFQTPLQLNHNIFGGGSNDAQSIIIDNLPVNDLYFYSELMITGKYWEIVGYNDQLVTGVTSMDDFYPFGTNVDSNGIINLGLEGPDRELAVLVKDPPLSEPVPEPGTMLLLGTGLAGLAGYGKLKVKRRKRA